MTLEELYRNVDGNYQEMLSRLRMESLVARFVVKFLDDASLRQLFDAWEAGDEQAAFEAAHTAKGVCANLSLTRLANLSSEVCEALRPGNEALRATTDVDALMGELKDAYEVAVREITAFSREM